MSADVFDISQDAGIRDLLNSGALDTSASDAFQRLAWLVSEVLEAPVVTISLGDGERFWLHSRVDISEESILTGVRQFRMASGAEDFCEVRDALVSFDYFDAAPNDSASCLRFFAGAPIFDRSGFICGHLTIADTKPRALSQDERTKLRCFSEQVESEVKVLMLMQEEANLRIEAAKAFAAKSTFLSLMSHEICTPLTGIIGATDLLMQEEGCEVGARMLRTIWSSASDLLQLLNETLDSAKIEAGGLSINTEPVSMTELCDTINQHFSVAAGHKGIEFNLSLDVYNDLPDLIYSDRMRLRQVIFNIIHNAIKFTREGQVRCRLILQDVGGRGDRAELFVEITDTGIGMAPETVDCLFEPFRQGDEGVNRVFNGTGLGMSLVKQLIDRMGGDVSVASAVGQGTRIRISLPVEPVNDVWMASKPSIEEGAIDEPPRLSQVEPGNLNGLQVLVADDNPQNRMILGRVLESWGCEVILAENGEEAFEIFRNASFDAIILDLHMPIRSGIEVARDIRRYTSSTRLIACTADTTEATKAQCQDVGFDMIVSKPFDWSRLFLALTQDQVRDDFAA